MSGLRAFLWQSFVVKFARGFRIKAEVELILPTKFKPRFGEGIVPILRAGMAFRQIRRVRRNFVSDDAVFHIFFVGQAGDDDKDWFH